MTYAALPDMRIPYDNDGTVVDGGTLGDGASTTYPSGTVVAYMNGISGTQGGGIASVPITPNTMSVAVLFMFFPEQREVTAFWTSLASLGHGAFTKFANIKGSNDTTNGLDGTWEASTFTYPSYPDQFAWRSAIQSISFTGPKKVIRWESDGAANDGALGFTCLHVYGAKGAGQTPDDIIYLNADAADAPFTAPIDFGDMPLGTSAIKHFKVQNASGTKTANTINIQCNDADFIISSDGVTWVVTINIASLAAGAKSGTLYIRDTAPNPGGRLGPRFARIVTTVASYT